MGLKSTQLAKLQKKVFYSRVSTKQDSAQNHSPVPAEYSQFLTFKKSRFLSVLNFVHPDFASKYIPSSVLPVPQLPSPTDFTKVGIPKIKLKPIVKCRKLTNG